MNLESPGFFFLILLVLLALNGFFVAVEFATVSVSRPRINQLASRGSQNARLVQQLLTDPDRVLAASQLGITMASLGLGWVGDHLAANFVAPLFDTLPVPIGQTLAHTIGFLVAFALITSLHIVVGEQAPKMAAIRFATATSLFTARAIHAFDFVFRPFIALLDRATEAVLSIFHIKSSGAHKIVYTVDELRQIVAESQHAGEIEVEERAMLDNVFQFRDRQVDEVMIPRTDIVAVDETATVTDFLKLFQQESHSRFPVYSGNIDNIVGFVWIKDVLRALAQDDAARQQSIKTVTRNALFVPDSKFVGALFAEMQRQKIQLAIVIDEYGGTAGMVTIEELIEEVVGRVADELTTAPPLLVRLDEGRAEAEGSLRVEEANEQLNLKLPESDEYETLAGLILTRLGRIPREGESITVDHVKLTVRAMNGPRIEKILVQRAPEKTNPPSNA
jgi:CBS domain containing-hemolysin-like protein